MLQNSKGITFVEVMFALVIFTVTIAFTTPILILLLKEKQSVDEQLVAYEILQNEFEEIRVLNKGPAPLAEKSIHKVGTTFFIYSEHFEQYIKICVKWQSKNGRDYEECGVLKWV